MKTADSRDRDRPNWGKFYSLQWLHSSQRRRLRAEWETFASFGDGRNAVFVKLKLGKVKALTPRGVNGASLTGNFLIFESAAIINTLWYAALQ
jgi:hypothetical protein